MKFSQMEFQDIPSDQETYLPKTCETPKAEDNKYFVTALNGVPLSPLRSQKTEIDFDGEPPKFFITPLALEKMNVYVQSCSLEIGWIGFIKQQGNNYTLYDVEIAEQKVNGAECEISTDGLSKLGMDILRQPNGTEKYNEMRFWGHSHVNMGVSPSSQDIYQFKELGKNSEYFFMMICNKRGDSNLFMRMGNYVFKFLNWSIKTDISLDVDSIQAKIKSCVSSQGGYQIYQKYESPIIRPSQEFQQRARLEEEALGEPNEEEQDFSEEVASIAEILLGNNIDFSSLKVLNTLFKEAGVSDPDFMTDESNEIFGLCTQYDLKNAGDSIGIISDIEIIIKNHTKKHVNLKDQQICSFVDAIKMVRKEFVNKIVAECITQISPEEEQCSDMELNVENCIDAGTEEYWVASDVFDVLVGSQEW